MGKKRGKKTAEDPPASVAACPAQPKEEDDEAAISSLVAPPPPAIPPAPHGAPLAEPSAAGGVASAIAEDETAPLRPLPPSRPSVTYHASSYSSLEQQPQGQQQQQEGLHVEADKGRGMLRTVRSEEQLSALEARAQCFRILVFRHLLAALAERMWEFAVVLLLTVVGPRNTFSLIASYGITVNVVVALLSPTLGARIDRTDRLTAVTAVTVMQNICTAVCAALFLILLYLGIGPEKRVWHILVVSIHVFGALNSLFYGLSNLTLERDWVVVIADEDSEWLRSITARLKQIDLCCDLVAPSLVSLLAMYSYEAVAIFISLANCLMVLLQYSAFHQVYTWVPRLDKMSPRQVLSGLASYDSSDDDLTLKESTGYQSEESPRSPLLGRLAREFMSHMQVYVRQDSFIPGLATAMLYLTVLSFHIVMVSYLLMRGMHVGVIGIGQGLASGAGVLGAMAYERIATKTGTLGAATIGIWMQTACLTVGVVGLFYPCLLEGILPSALKLDGLSLPIFLGSIVLSRFGLFLYEVAVVQVYQLMVEELERNVVGGFQRTLESLFELASFVMVLALSKPSQFPLQALLSYAMVFLAASLFTAWTIIRRAAAARRARASSAASSSWYGSKALHLQDPESGGLLAHRGPGELVPSDLLFQRLDTILSVGSAGEKSMYRSILSSTDDSGDFVPTPNSNPQAGKTTRTAL